MNPEILVIFTVGTSASGKSTWAHALAEKYPLLRVQIIERDHIRRSLHQASHPEPFTWSQWDTGREEEVQTAWLQATRDALDNDVLVLSDTHLHPDQIYREALHLAQAGVRDMTIEFFPAQPLIELIRYDQNRPAPVGAAVLRDQLQRLGTPDRYWESLERGLAEGSIEETAPAS